MAGTEINKSLLSGSNSLLLLQLLSEKEMYGYEMIEVLRERSMNVLQKPEGRSFRRAGRNGTHIRLQ